VTIRERLADRTFTVRDLAIAHAGEEAVTRADLDRARYHIEALTKEGLLTTAGTTKNGVANRWQLADLTSDSQEPTENTYGNGFWEVPE
jgi:hypothetical protein